MSAELYSSERFGMVEGLALLTLFCSASAVAIAQPTLRITSPPNWTVVTAGQTVRVIVEATPANAFIGVTILATWQGAESRLSPPWEFAIKVPEYTTAGKCAITAMGAVTPGQPIYSAAIGVIVEGPDGPATLRVQPRVFNSAVGGTIYMLVFGDFPGGQKLDLTKSTRIKYTMDQPGIIAIADQGIVTALAPGSTKLTITYGQGKIEVPVTVSAPGRPGGKQ